MRRMHEIQIKAGKISSVKAELVYCYSLIASELSVCIEIHFV